MQFRSPSQFSFHQEPTRKSSEKGTNTKMNKWEKLLLSVCVSLLCLSAFNASLQMQVAYAAPLSACGSNCPDGICSTVHTYAGHWDCCQANVKKRCSRDTVSYGTIGPPQHGSEEWHCYLDAPGLCDYIYNCTATGAC